MTKPDDDPTTCALVTEPEPQREGLERQALRRQEIATHRRAAQRKWIYLAAAVGLVAGLVFGPSVLSMF